MYHVFGLGLRDVGLLLAGSEIIVFCEGTRRWCLRFGHGFADKLRQRRLKPGDNWHLDEVFLQSDGEQHYLWRTVDQHGVVLGVLVEGFRDPSCQRHRAS